MSQATHPNSAAAAAAHDRTKARTDRRLICEMVARCGMEGCSDDDLARGIPSLHSNSIRLRRGDLTDKVRADGSEGPGYITDSLGMKKKSASGMAVTAWHITAKGLKALEMDPATNWHSATPAANQ